MYTRTWLEKRFQLRAQYEGTIIFIHDQDLITNLRVNLILTILSEKYGRKLLVLLSVNLMEFHP